MLLTVQAQPNAKTTKVVGWITENTVKIKVGAPAKEGKANRELVSWLADRLRVAKSEIEFVHGKTTRIKLLEIPLPDSTIKQRLKK